MAALDWSQCPAVESTLSEVSGACEGHTTVIENLEDLSASGERRDANGNVCNHLRPCGVLWC